LAFGLCLSTAALAQVDFSISPGQSGFKLLKLQPSARASGLSGAGSALPGLGSDQDQNPAVVRPEWVELSVGMASLPEQFASSIQHTAWRVPAGPGTVTGRVRYEGFQDLAGYDEEDRSTGLFSASTWSAGAGYSWVIDSAWTLGARAAYARNTVERFSNWAIAGDVGLRFAPKAPWSLGASLLNVGYAAKPDWSDSAKETLPTTIVLGGAWRFPVLHGWHLTAMADLRHPNDEEWTAPIGLEASWSILTLRTGFPLLLEDARPSLGAGLAWENLRLDASVAWHAATGMTSGLELALGL
jgi:hypothetical protein